MIYFSVLFFLTNTLPLFSSMIDMTPVAWPLGTLPGVNNIRQELEIHEIFSTTQPIKKLTAILPDSSLLDMLEEQLAEGEIGEDFSNIKQKRLDKLTTLVNSLPRREQMNPFYNMGYTGVNPQTIHNTGIIDRIINGTIKDSRTPLHFTLESTLDKAYRGQALIKYVDPIDYAQNPKTYEVYGWGSAFFFRKNAAITAAHCVCDTGYKFSPETGLRNMPATGWKSKKIVVFPAHDNGHGPLKGYSPSQIFIPQAWIDSEHLYNHDPRRYYSDYAVMIFDKNVVELTGSLGLISLANTIPDLDHPFNLHAVQVGGYPSSIGVYDECDRVGNNKNGKGKQITDQTYYRSVYNIDRIVDNRLIKHSMDTTPGQSGCAIMPHYDDVFDYRKEPYAIGITSHGNYESNKGVLITEQILRWALDVSKDYHIHGEPSVYTLTFPQMMDRAKKEIAFLDAILADSEIKEPLKNYRQRWGKVLARIALKTSVLDQDRALSIHKYASKEFLNNVSSHYVALHAERK